MTTNPATCAPATSLRLVAQLMSDHDWAAMPVVDFGRLVGLITDRDIACRAVASGADAPSLPASSVMTPCVIAVGPDDPIEKAMDLMEDNVIRHLPVIGERGQLLGILAQSDVGRRLTNREFGDFARKTSIRNRPVGRPSQIVLRRG